MRINYYDIDFRQERACVYVYAYVYAYTYTRAPAQAIKPLPYSRVSRVGWLAALLLLACLVRCRAWVNKDAPRWSMADVYDRDLR